MANTLILRVPTTQFTAPALQKTKFYGPTLLTMKVRSISLILFLLLGYISVAQITLLTEGINTPAANPTPVASHTFQNSGVLTYTCNIGNTACDVRTSAPSANPGPIYVGASGTGNVFIGKSSVSNPSYFQIEGINTSGVSSLALTFGEYKSGTAASNELEVMISTNGSSWSFLTYTRPTGSGTNTWLLITPTGTIPSTPNLRIRFRNSSPSYDFRVDDIKLTGSPSISWANLQSPASGTIITGDNFVTYARVDASGYTYIDGAQPDMLSEFGYSTNNSNPSGADWTWIPGSYSIQAGTKDEYLIDLGGQIFLPGTYYYASRFSIAAGPVTYGGYSSGGGGIWNGTTYVSGVLTVIDSQVAYANAQSPFSGTVAALGTYNVKAQVGQPGVTNGAGQGPGLQAWIGYSQVNNNPNTPGWSWVPASYDPSVVGANDQYVANIGPYLNANSTFYYAARFQLGTGTYSYGAFHMDGVSPGNFWDGTTYVSGSVAVTGATGTGDYYRSRSSGPWTDIASWQSSTDNSTWQNATRSPTQAASAVTIRSGHTIDSSTSVTIDDLTINTGGTLEISGGTFTLNNGAAATDLLVDGTFTNSGATFTNNGAIVVNGTYNHDTSSLTLPVATWGVGSSCVITGLNNVFQTPLINGGQVFYNFTLSNNDSQNLVSIVGPIFQVNGTLTLGPNPASYLLLATGAGTYTRTVNKLNVLDGQLTVSGSQSVVTFNVLTDVLVSGGRLGLIGGNNGKATMNIGNNLVVDSVGIFSMIDHSLVQPPVLNITGDLTISGIEPTFEMESTSAASAQSTVNVAGDFICTALYDGDPILDFGYGIVANNAINIAGDFIKTGDGTFSTSSTNPAKGFVFSGSGLQMISDTGTITSDHVNYTVNNGASVKLASDITLGGGIAPASVFTVNAGGTMDFDTFSLKASDATSKFAALGSAPPSATLKTANIDGLGGTTAVGSLQNFADVGPAAANAVRLLSGVNYTFNGNTSTPYPVPTASITSTGTLTINANVVSNMDSSFWIDTAFNVNGGASYTMNPASVLNDHKLNSSVLTIAAGGVFDNGGENRVVKGGSSPLVFVNGRFITRDQQGLIGTNAALSGFSGVNIVMDVNGVIEYGYSGDQLVQGTTAPIYTNVVFSGSGTKSLLSSNPVSGSITVKDSAIFDAVSFVFGGAGTNLTMTDTSRYKTGGSGIKPDAGGLYSLAPGTTIEFYSPVAAVTNPIKNGVLYANVEVSGNNIVNTGVTGLQFQPGSTFTVKTPGIFKLLNPAGFTGSSATAIDGTAPATVILEPGSVVEYLASGNQTITPLLPSYSNLKISGSGIKSFAFTPEIKVGEDLMVTAGTLQIDTNVTMTVTNAVLNTGGVIDIRNSGSLVQVTDVLNATANNNVGNVKMDRNANNMYRYDFTYWSSPVTESSSFSLFDLSPLTRSDKYFKWDATTQGWLTIYNGAEDMLSGIGYILRAPDNFPTSPATTLPFSTVFLGKPNNGIVTVPVVGSSSALAANYKFNLLGNPYPSALFADTFITANPNLGGTLYFWTHNTAASATPDANGQYYYSLADYATYNMSGGTAAAPSASTGGANTNIPSGKIAAAQGFFIRGITDGASTATFNNSMRIAGQNSQFYRMANGNQFGTSPGIERHRIWLNLTNTNNGFSQNLTAYAEGATNGLDRLFDGEMLSGSPITLYSVVDQTKLTSQGRALPFDVNDTVPIGYTTTIADTLQIAIENFDGLFENQNIYLEDKLLTIIHDLKESPYSFTSEAGEFNGRFLLRYTTAALAVPNFSANALVVTVKDRKINVYSTGSEISKISVYDLLGRKLFDEGAINAATFSITNISMSQQVLIVKTTLADGKIISTKIVY